MNWFPMFINLENREIIICGGGKHALEKVGKMLPFSPMIHVVSEKISSEIKEIQGILWNERTFSEKDLECTPAFVIAAESEDENKRILDICEKRHIPVNAVDMPHLCDFIFPALLATDQLCIGISTGGISPTAAICLKKEIDRMIPSNIDKILLWMPSAKEFVKSAVPKENQNKALLHLAEKAFSENRPLDICEATEIAATYK